MITIIPHLSNANRFFLFREENEIEIELIDDFIWASMPITNEEEDYISRNLIKHQQYEGFSNI